MINKQCSRIYKRKEKQDEGNKELKKGKTVIRNYWENKDIQKEKDK